jgi:hypothetical protein
MGTKDADERAVMQVLDEFIDALNARNPKRLATACNFPHVRFSTSGMKIWRTDEEFGRDGDLAGIPLEGEWHHTSWDARNTLQASSEKLHVAVTFTRYTSNGAKISTFNSLYIVTKRKGHWGVQIRSSFAP